ncbi:hypothetical protein BKA81DRAFT_147 [Phyllosticta paracitricarpa]|uniref:Uncharacterized protein n=1 Tax=Phyllosticta citricarpa TaxID=55181 RepID=A0ABR1MKL5_9PEZI
MNAAGPLQYRCLCNQRNDFCQRTTPSQSPGLHQSRNRMAKDIQEGKNKKQYASCRYESRAKSDTWIAPASTAPGKLPALSTRHTSPMTRRAKGDTAAQHRNDNDPLRNKTPPKPQELPTIGRDSNGEAREESVMPRTSRCRNWSAENNDLPLRGKCHLLPSSIKALTTYHIPSKAPSNADRRIQRPNPFYHKPNPHHSAQHFHQRQHSKRNETCILFPASAIPATPHQQRRLPGPGGVIGADPQTPRRQLCASEACAYAA